MRLVRRLASRDGPRSSPGAELVFVTPPASAPGWILEAICREVGARLDGVQPLYVPFGAPLPPARRYFFSHYMYFVGSLAALQRLEPAHSYVFATHLEPDKHRIGSRLLARLLDRSDGVICMNDALRRTLAASGVSERRLSVAVGAADWHAFQPHARRPDGCVGLSSAYYARKSPDLVLDVVRALPGRRFKLLGQGWRRYPRFDELQALPNFEYVEAPYAEYPGHYASMSVFVSASQLEGGPIPLIEAMMSNVVPVASRTGFAPDLIEHGRNGLLFDVGAPAAEIAALIEQAYRLDADVRRTVRHCHWQPFAETIAARIGLGAERPAAAAEPAPLAQRG